MKSNSADNSAGSKQIRFRYKDNLHFGKVVDYLSKEGYDLKQELMDSLTSRFITEAQSDEGKINRALALQCISKLQGYIYVIEQLAELEDSTKQIPNSRSSNPVSFGSDDDDDEEDEPEEEIDFDRMLGLK